MAEELKIAEELQDAPVTEEKTQVEDYVKRMITEYIELDARIVALNQFINNRFNDIDKVEFGHMIAQLNGMVQYRNGLASRLQLRGVVISNGKAYQTKNVEINTDNPPVEESENKDVNPNL